MPSPKILVFAGSLRAGSHNGRLATLASQELAMAGAEHTHISLADFPLPIYDADLAKSELPENARRLKVIMSVHPGVFIASPEYNASVTPLLKNAIDWISAVREPAEPALAAYQNRAFGLGAASPGRSGGMQSLLALRQILAVGCRALVIPEQVAVPNAGDAFDEAGRLKDRRAAEQLKLVTRRLIDYARMFEE